jgi:hypothetical protein
LTFLKNHREVIVAFDLFTVPTLTFQLLYCFFVIEHGRRRILHFNVTRHPTADWVVQQLREAFPDAVRYRYAILDHDSKFDADVIAFLKATGLKPKRTSVQAPWQNGLAERWVGSCRREILDHVIALNEQHLRRLVRDYVSYYHDDRIHHSLDKDTPNRRPVESKPSPSATVISSARLGAFIIDIAGAKLRKARSRLPTRCCSLRSGAGVRSTRLPARAIQWEKGAGGALVAKASSSVLLFHRLRRFGLGNYTYRQHGKRSAPLLNLR